MLDTLGVAGASICSLFGGLLLYDALSNPGANQSFRVIGGAVLLTFGLISAWLVVKSNWNGDGATSKIARPEKSWCHLPPVRETQPRSAAPTGLLPKDVGIGPSWLGFQPQQITSGGRSIVQSNAQAYSCGVGSAEARAKFHD